MTEAARKICGAAFVGVSVLLAATCSAAPTTSYDSRAKAEYGPIFTRVLQKYIGSQPGPNICLPPLFGYGEMVNESVDVSVSADMDEHIAGANSSASRLAQFKALEVAGLVSSTESERTVNGKTRRTQSFKRTAKGLAVSKGPSICYARGELDQVTKWKGPAALGEYQAAFVYYTTKTVHIEDWAKSADILAAFPSVSPVVKGEKSKVRQIVIDLSSEGWDIAEYSQYLQM